MKDMSYLALGTTQCFPFLIGDIRRVARLGFRKREEWTAAVHCHTLLFCISGSAKGHFVNERIHADRKFSFKKNALLYLEPEGRFELTAMTDNLQLLLAEFFLNTPSVQEPFPPDHLSEQYLHSTQPRPVTSLSINLPFHTAIELGSFMGWYLNRLTAFASERSDTDIGPLNQLFPSLIIRWLRISQCEIDSMLHQVDSISVTSDMAYHEPLQPGQELCVSDVELWNGHPKYDPQSTLLGVFSTRDVFVSRSWTGTPAVCRESPVCGPYMSITAEKESTYSILIFPKVPGTTVNLKPFRDTCYFRFFFRSNRAFHVSIAAYSCRCFRGVGYVYAYTTPGEWAEEIAPVLSTYQSVRTSPYIDKAVEYVKTNYQNPIRRKDLAQYAGIRSEYLSDLFHQQLGISVTAYIHQVRLLESIKLLQSTSLPIEEIAFRTGFYDGTHYSKAFQKQYGLRPSVYRARYAHRGKEDTAYGSDTL